MEKKIIKPKLILIEKCSDCGREYEPEDVEQSPFNNLKCLECNHYYIRERNTISSRRNKFEKEL